LADVDLTAREELINPDLEWLAGLAEADFERRFNGSPVRRAGFPGLRRNIAIAMGNSGLVRFLPRLEDWAIEDSGAVAVPDREEARSAKSIEDRQALRKAAQWAIRRLTKVGERRADETEARG
jgi:epoxyqueuosine reductase